MQSAQFSPRLRALPVARPPELPPSASSHRSRNPKPPTTSSLSGVNGIFSGIQGPPSGGTAAPHILHTPGLHLPDFLAFKLVGKLLAAKRDLRLEQELKKLDGFDVLILDDIGYVQQSREEMEVLFTLLAERYERRSLLISSNLVFSQWDQIFKDPMTTMAAIDRLVHRSIILEFDGASQRVKKAGEKVGEKAPKPEVG